MLGDLISFPSKLVITGASIGIIGYCLYFDHKRRNHPNFKKNLIKKRKQQRLEESQMDNLDLPDLNDTEAVQEFFLKQLHLGETVLAVGDIEAGIKHFATAVAICASPSQLLQVLQQSLSPAAFQLLIETLPSVKKFMFLILFVYLPVLWAQDPFEMFPYESNHIESPKPISQNRKEAINTEFNQEVHRILVQIFWTKLNRAIDAHHNIDYTNYMHHGLYAFNLQIIPENFAVINQYINGNKSISPESINKLFNHLLTSHVQVTMPSSFNTEIDISFSDVLFYGLYVFCFLFVIVCVYKKPILSSVVFLTGLTISLTMYKRYSTAWANKMAHMSRYPDLPHECIPESKQPWYRRYITSWFSNTEVCKEYFHRLNHDPIYELNPAHIFYDIMSDPILHFSGVFGSSLGAFYANLNAWIPFWLIPFVVLFSCVPLFIMFRHFLIPIVLSKSKSKVKRKPRQTKTLPMKNSTNDAITDK
ncbi:WD repeat-containing protein 63 [Cichlidogyrus casuarinus]|uniref:WD repeat-containing protein 63 n=1 Tax=Cichlidogyrus casuarinus TaxID=1844966 RepID=A0ABD2PZ66_9PLAT